MYRSALPASLYTYFGIGRAPTGRFINLARQGFHTSLQRAQNDLAKLPEIAFPSNLESSVREALTNLPSPYQAPQSVGVRMADALRSALPQSTLKLLERMRDTSEPGILLINDFPVGNIPEGKSGEHIEQRLQRKDFISEGMMLGLAHLMGHELSSHPYEQGGKPIHNIAPVPGKENTQSSKGRQQFALHTENPFEAIPPHYLLLVGMESDPRAQTSYLPTENILGRLSSQTLEIMKKPEFFIHSGAGVDGRIEGTFPLLDGRHEKMDFLRLYQDQSRLHGKTNEAKTALEDLKAAFKASQDSGEIGGVGLKAGQALLFENACGPKLTDSIEENVKGSVMHGKMGYTDNPFRWMQRGFLKPREIPHTRS